MYDKCRFYFKIPIDFLSVASGCAESWPQVKGLSSSLPHSHLAWVLFKARCSWKISVRALGSGSECRGTIFPEGRELKSSGGSGELCGRRLLKSRNDVMEQQLMLKGWCYWWWLLGWIYFYLTRCKSQVWNLWRWACYNKGIDEVSGLWGKLVVVGFGTKVICLR